MTRKQQVFFYSRTILLLIVIMGSVAAGFGQEQILVIDSAAFSKPIGQYVYVFEDEQSNIPDSVIIQQNVFVREDKKIPVNPKISEGTLWLRFTIVNTLADSLFYLDLDYSNISELFLYRYINNKLNLLSHTGNSYNYYPRQTVKSGFAFPLKQAQGDTCVYYLKLNSKHPLLLPIFIRRGHELEELSGNENLIFGIYFGIIISILLYNLFLFISTRDLSYLFYVIFLFFLGFAQVTISGFGFKYFWPYYPFFNNYALTISSALAGIMGILFAIFFLRTGYYFRRMIYVLSGIVLLYFLAIVASISENNQLSYDILNYAGLAAGIILIIIAFLTGRKGYKPAYFYFVAWVFFLAGIIIFALRNLGVLPYTSFTTYVLYIGSAIEVVLLSTALADRINILRKEKEESQVYALKISRENENLIREQNIVLEQKVTERTNELLVANNQLSKTLGELKDAQTQLVEAEKMASLGQLTAGIAHEINNPINFVKSNIKPLSLDIEDLFSIINDYNLLHEKENGQLTERLKQVYKKQQELDLEFIKTEIKQLIKGIEDGAERTAEIVRGLRTFSRLDESELKVANIHDGINSTIVLLRNSMPPNVQIVKDLKAKGSLECFPGKLNQVLMNILNNAIQAIGEKEIKNQEEFINITTEDTADNKIRISIKDTGPGMTEEVKQRIFEPFFTTKTVGVGTGLGLAIVFKIIQEHFGKIEIVTSPGNGAEFIITLPYLHPSN